jgi:hypothetical protein
MLTIESVADSDIGFSTLVEMDSMSPGVRCYNIPTIKNQPGVGTNATIQLRYIVSTPPGVVSTQSFLYRCADITWTSSSELNETAASICSDPPSPGQDDAGNTASLVDLPAAMAVSIGSVMFAWVLLV